MFTEAQLNARPPGGSTAAWWLDGRLVPRWPPGASMAAWRLDGRLVARWPPAGRLEDDQDGLTKLRAVALRRGAAQTTDVFGEKLKDRCLQDSSSDSAPWPCAAALRRPPTSFARS